MILEHLVVGMLQTNCYILADRKTRQAVVVDPGGNFERIAARIDDLRLKVEAIINTHAHFDHVMDAWALKKRVGGEIYMHPSDEPLLQDSMVGMAAMFSQPSRPMKVQVDRLIREGEVLQFGSIRLQVLETPGHTPGHISLYCQEEGLIFVGDTLFSGSIGRTDFPGGSYDQLIRSVKEKIFPLPGETRVLPGHGPDTSVERERKINPFFM